MPGRADSIQPLSWLLVGTSSSMTATFGMAAIISRAPRPEPEDFYRWQRQAPRRAPFSFPRSREQWQSSSIRLEALMNALLAALKERLARAAAFGAAGVAGAAPGLVRARHPLILLGALALVIWALVRHPPLITVAPGDVAIRTNALTGNSSVLDQGSAFSLPLLHDVRR